MLKRKRRSMRTNIRQPIWVVRWMMKPTTSANVSDVSAGSLLQAKNYGVANCRTRRGAGEVRRNHGRQIQWNRQAILLQAQDLPRYAAPPLKRCGGSWKRYAQAR